MTSISCTVYSALNYTSFDDNECVIAKESVSFITLYFTFICQHSIDTGRANRYYLRVFDYSTKVLFRKKLNDYNCQRLISFGNYIAIYLRQIADACFWWILSVSRYFKWNSDKKLGKYSKKILHILMFQRKEKQKNWLISVM